MARRFARAREIHGKRCVQLGEWFVRRGVGDESAHCSLKEKTMLVRQLLAVVAPGCCHRNGIARLVVAHTLRSAAQCFLPVAVCKIRRSDSAVVELTMQSNFVPYLQALNGCSGVWRAAAFARREKSKFECGGACAAAECDRNLLRINVI